MQDKKKYTVENFTMNKFLQSSVFCSRPFTSLYIATDGTFKFCCVETYSYEESVSPNNNIRNTDIFELWNSKVYRDFRSKFLNEIKPKACKNCFQFLQKPCDGKQYQSNGARRLFDDQLGMNFQDYNDIMNLNSITFIELWFSNKCNLKCRMCNPYHTNQLIDEWNNIIASNSHMQKLHPFINYNTKKELEKIGWDEDPRSWYNLFNFFKKIYENNPNQIIKIIMSGGEPMICEGMYKFFNLAINSGISKNIILKYNTNLTILPSKMIEYWKHFKAIDLAISIDGYNRVNDYIRYPSKWNKIVTNIDHLNELTREINIIANVRPTIQAYNILSITELYEWMLNKPFNNGKKYNHLFLSRLNDPLTSPEIFDITILPKKLKDMSTERLLTFLEKNKNNKYIVNNNIYQSGIDLIKYMYSKDKIDLFPKFLETTKYFDKTRNQNIMDIMPELNRL
jgi:hypothetical protein